MTSALEEQRRRYQCVIAEVFGIRPWELAEMPVDDFLMCCAYIDERNENSRG